MKRIALIAVMLIGSVVGAKADRDIWSSTSGHPRGDAALQADITSGPILTFASLRSGHFCECWNQRTTSKI